MKFNVGDRVYHTSEKFTGIIVAAVKGTSYMIECEYPFASPTRGESEKIQHGLLNGYCAAERYLEPAAIAVDTKDADQYYAAITSLA